MCQKRERERCRQGTGRSAVRSGNQRSKATAAKSERQANGRIPTPDLVSPSSPCLLALRQLSEASEAPEIHTKKRKRYLTVLGAYAAGKEQWWMMEKPSKPPSGYSREMLLLMPALLLQCMCMGSFFWRLLSVELIWGQRYRTSQSKEVGKMETRSENQDHEKQRKQRNRHRNTCAIISSAPRERGLAKRERERDRVPFNQHTARGAWLVIKDSSNSRSRKNELYPYRQGTASASLMHTSAVVCCASHLSLVARCSQLRGHVTYPYLFS